MGTTPRVAACMYCGRSRLVDNAFDTDTEEILVKKATEQCDCEQALNQQQTERIKLKAAENIDEIFSGEFPEMAQILNAAVIPIMEGIIDSVTVNAKTGTQGRVWRTNTKTSTIKVERTDTTKTAKES